MMAEACIGLALMALAWILISYSLFLANNDIRTEMAARYAAWHQGASGDGTAVTASQVDQYFFFQSGLSTVSSVPPALIGDVITGNMSADSSNYSPDSSGGDGPFKVKVTFGISDPNSSSNPFPFDLLKTHVPFMPDSMMATYSVSSTCQWDGTGETWRSPGKALEGIWNTLKDTVTSTIKKML